MTRGVARVPARILVRVCADTPYGGPCTASGYSHLVKDDAADGVTWPPFLSVTRTIVAQGASSAPGLLAAAASLRAHRPSRPRRPFALRTEMTVARLRLLHFQTVPHVPIAT